MRCVGPRGSSNGIPGCTSLDEGCNYTRQASIVLSAASVFVCGGRERYFDFELYDCGMTSGLVLVCYCRQDKRL